MGTASGALTAAGVIGPLVLGPNDGEFRVTTWGTFTGLQWAAQATVGGFTLDTDPIAVFSENNPAWLTGTVNTGSTPQTYIGRCRGFQQLQLNVTQVSTGTANLRVDTANTFGTPAYSPIAASAIPPASFSTAARTTTFAAGDLTGSGDVFFGATATTPGSIATRTAAQMLADFPGATVGLSYAVTIINTGTSTLTVTAGTGVTLTGTMTIATNTTREFVVTFTSATAVTIQSVGVGTIS